MRAAAERSLMDVQSREPTDLSFLKTKDLVAELSRRDGVDVSTLAFDVDASVKVSGPAIVLVVID